jgi:hypothetical protein
MLPTSPWLMMISPFLSVVGVALPSTSHLLTMMTPAVTYLFPNKAVDSHPIGALLRGPPINYPLWRIPLSQEDETKVSIDATCAYIS